MNSWTPTPLAKLLKQNKTKVEISSIETYKQVTIKMWGKGVVLRDIVDGLSVNATARQVTRTGQFIVSRIDARHGALGLVPSDLDGAIVTNDFPVFDINTEEIDPRYLDWYTTTQDFIEICKRASEGTTNRVRLKIDKFLDFEIPLPPIQDQNRIVAHIEALSRCIEETRGLHDGINEQLNHLLYSMYSEIIEDVPYKPMSEIAPIIRRPVEVKIEHEYDELGVRSFGKGTFHKPAIKGIDIGTKRIYWFKPNDLVFSNVFAWEGGIAVVQPEDDGRVGSHRFITCVPKGGIATSDFLCFHFLAPKGFKDIQDASPGGAGRNRTLGLRKLERIEVPLPEYHKQVWFGELIQKTKAINSLLEETNADMNDLLPSILDKAFKGELQFGDEPITLDDAFGLSDRQRIMIEILAQASQMDSSQTRSIETTKLMKYIFLNQQEGELIGIPHDFYPYHYGATADTVYTDFESLVDLKLIREQKQKKKRLYKLNKIMQEVIQKERDKLPQSVKDSINQIVQEYGGLKLNDLLIEVYAKYPEYAVKAKRADLVERAIEVRQKRGYV